ncbi:MAG: hypothetical protein K2Y71_04525 [Xanthobacteraceae bacterium]|nr:hypothetical protein [Xanthobacteraceae bacterium]
MAKPTLSALRAKNTKDQYEALGRFVEAFEAMVDKARSVSVDLLSRSAAHENLVTIALHHPVMTATPLFEIMRAMIMEILKEDRHPLHNDRQLYAAVLRQISTEYMDLVSTRNNLLHGTWFVGHVSLAGIGVDEAKEFFIRKHKPTKDGLDQLDLPKKPEELLKLVERCQKTGTWIVVLYTFLADHRDIRQAFYKENGTSYVLDPEFG